MPGRTAIVTIGTEEQAPCDCWIPRGQRSPCDRTGFIYDERAQRNFDCPRRAAFLVRRAVSALGADFPPYYRGMAIDRYPLDGTWIDSPIRDRLREYHSSLRANLDSGRGLWLMGQREIKGTDPRKTPPVARNAVASWFAETCKTRGVGRYMFFEGQAFFHCAADARRRGASLARLARDADVIFITNIDEILITSHAADMTYAAQLIEDLQHPEKKFNPAILHGWAASDLYDLINTRFEDEKALVLTSGCMPPGALAERLGPEIVYWLEQSCELLNLNDEPLPPSALAADFPDFPVHVTRSKQPGTEMRITRATHR